MTRSPSRFRQSLFGLLAGVLAVLVLEGGATALLLVYDLVFWSQAPVAERQHSVYDPEIGWVARPDLSLPDLFGPGIGVRTNAQGFRRGEDTEKTVPPNRIRVVASGDSFTFGYGVSNEEAWPAVLERSNPRLEVVNLGMSGYGFDQAFLWYRRAGLGLEHQVHVFAFISDDFERMRRTQVFGYDKPRLVLENGELALENVPVPQLALRFPWWRANEHHFRRIGLVRVAERALRAVSGRDRETSEIDHPNLVALVEKILEELVAVHQAEGRQLVLVSLPVRHELDPGVSPPSLAFVRRAAAEHGIPWVDVVAAARALPSEQREGLFGRTGHENDPALAGHLSVAGNRFVAEQLARALEPLLGDPS